jgi:HD superfamily phosphohydrolase
MPRDFNTESLSHDPIHGYIPFVSRSDLPAGEVAEQELIDHPWVQRLRQIHQLQTAWWVFPSAEHMRFQHVLGAMHLASRAIDSWYDSLVESCDNVPSRPCVESLVRLAALLHDVGHGPFGHFFDDHFLDDFGITHEDLGAQIIEEELGEMIRRVRRNPNGQLQPLEELDPRQVAWLIRRPRVGEQIEGTPDWLCKLRSLFSGIYTVDNMDFVLRDAYMTGYSQRSYDLERLVRYSFFSQEGLTIHDRGIHALLRFMGARAELFRNVYFHRSVRGIDIALADVFARSMPLLFPGNPCEHLSEYQKLTEASLLVDVGRWKDESAEKGELGAKWQELLQCQVPWTMVCQRTMTFDEGDSEASSIFTDQEFVEKKLRSFLPDSLRELELRIDIARHIFRPLVQGPAVGQNYLFDSATDQIRPLTSHELIDRQPVAQRICRIYARNMEHQPALAAALQQLAGHGEDDLTNM